MANTQVKCHSNTGGRNRQYRVIARSKTRSLQEAIKRSGEAHVLEHYRASNTLDRGVETQEKVTLGLDVRQ